MQANRRIVLTGFASLGIASVAGSAVAGAQGGDEAGLRVAHASPDAPAVDVYVDGVAVISGLKFREVTDYLEVSTGSYEVKVNVVGTETTVFGPVELDLAAEDSRGVASESVS